jgi:hypothetical protein
LHLILTEGKLSVVASSHASSLSSVIADALVVVLDKTLRIPAPPKFCHALDGLTAVPQIASPGTLGSISLDLIGILDGLLGSIVLSLTVVLDGLLGILEPTGILDGLAGMSDGPLMEF